MYDDEVESLKGLRWGVDIDLVVVRELLFGYLWILEVDAEPTEMQKLVDEVGGSQMSEQRRRFIDGGALYDDGVEGVVDYKRCHAFPDDAVEIAMGGGVGLDVSEEKDALVCLDVGDEECGAKISLLVCGCAVGEFERRDEEPGGDGGGVDAACERVEGEDAHGDQVWPHEAVEEVVFDRGDRVGQAVDGLWRRERRRVDDETGNVVQVGVCDEVCVDGVEDGVCRLETRPARSCCCCCRRLERFERVRDGEVGCVDVGADELSGGHARSSSTRGRRPVGGAVAVLRVELEQEARLQIAAAVVQDVDDGRQACAGVDDKQGAPCVLRHYRGIVHVGGLEQEGARLARDGAARAAQDGELERSSVGWHGSITDKLDGDRWEPVTDVAPGGEGEGPSVVVSNGAVLSSPLLWLALFCS